MILNLCYGSLVVPFEPPLTRLRCLYVASEQKARVRWAKWHAIQRRQRRHPLILPSMRAIMAKLGRAQSCVPLGQAPVGPLLDQIMGPVVSVTGNGAYDRGRRLHQCRSAPPGGCCHRAATPNRRAGMGVCHSIEVTYEKRV